MEWIKWALYLFSFVSVTRRMEVNDVKPLRRISG
jgi:hypothetical protein